VSQMTDNRLWDGDQDFAFTNNTGGREASAAEGSAAGPFLLRQGEAAGYETGTGTGSHMQSWAETADIVSNHETLVGAERLLDEVPAKVPTAATGTRGLSEPDPYFAIRAALSPEHAHLTAEEIAVNFGRTPAIVALHQALASPQPQLAALAVLLGRAGRRSTQVQTSNIAIPSYLRLLARLCLEAAEQSEAELGAEVGGSGGGLAVAEAEVPATRQQVVAGSYANAPPAVVARWPLGVDIYSGQKMDGAAFVNLKRQGKTFAIVKSSQGTVQDGKFPTYYKLAKDTGMIRGSYHFFANKSAGVPQPWLHGTISDQAATVISLVKRLGPGDLAPALDLEDEPRKPADRYPLDQGILPVQQGYHYRRTGDNPQWRAGVEALLRDIQTFLATVETALGRTPMIYTSHMWRDSDMMNDPKVLSQHPVWTVYHGERDLTAIKLGAWGNSWDFIQYAEDGKNYWGMRPYHEHNIPVEGIDFNAYNGTIYGLRGLADMGRPGVAMAGNLQYIAHADSDGRQHLLVGPGWADHDLSRGSARTGGDPVLLASPGAFNLYFCDGDHLVEAAATGPLSAWTFSQIEQPGDAKPIHDPRAVLFGSKRHVCYWGDDDDWYLLTLEGVRKSSFRVLTLANIKTTTGQGRSTGQPTVYVSQGIVHLVGRVGSTGHLLDVWLDGHGSWQKDDITALARDLAASMPAATYSPCVYETSDGVGIVFRAVGGDTWVVTRHNNAPSNLTAATHAITAAGHPTCFVLHDKPHIIYRGSDRLLHDISLDAGVWKVQQICNVKAAADPVATADGATGFVAVRAADGMIHAARFDGRYWTCGPAAGAA
jgi:lysozyme